MLQPASKYGGTLAAAFKYGVTLAAGIANFFLFCALKIAGKWRTAFFGEA
jgi:hypothetical protein